MRVLVVGASIAGPSAAYWLAKAGAQVTVIERFPSLRTGGQNVDIRTSGVKVMRKLPGMEEAVRQKMLRLQGMGLVGDDGQSYGFIRSSGDPDQQTIVSEFEIFRGDLCQILYDLSNVGEKVTYRFGDQIESMRGEDGPITVDFTSGSSAEYDLVVACDGATSRTRAMGLSCAQRDYLHSTGTWAAYFSMPQDLLDGKMVALGHSAVGGRVCFVGPDPEKGVTRVILTRANGKDDSLPFRAAVTAGQDALKRYVHKVFSGMRWRSDEIMQALLASDDFYASEILRVKPPTLSRGRFVLVGDAGAATGLTGFGTSLAMTGGYVLAGEIVKAGMDIDKGLQGYEKMMRPLITEMQSEPPFVSSFMAPQTAWGIFVRNMFFAFLTWSGVVNFAQRYLGGAFGSSDQHQIPDYKWP